MTYTHLRATLSQIALFGEDGAPNTLLPAMRWHTLKCAGVVELVGGLWVLNARGWAVLQESEMPRVRPADRPVQRKSSRATRQQQQRRSA